MSGLGLDYSSGDSEISDEEDEYGSKLGELAPPGLVSSGLGIPHLRNLSTDYTEEFSVPVVQSAPLVAYGPDDDHDLLRESISSHLDDSAAVVLDDSGSLENENYESGLSEEEDDDESHLTKYSVTLPPDPPGRCSNALQDKVIQILEKKKRFGSNPSTNIMKRKDFRNPSIYNKLVQFLNLDEYGTNYPKERFDPHEWPEDSYYDNLARAQKEHHEKKEKAKLSRTQVDFVASTSTKRPISAPAAPADAKRQRKSKWDLHNDSSSKGNSPELKVGAQALANAAQLNAELNKLGNR